MYSKPASAYFEQKTKLLMQCIEISEELFGCFESEGDLQAILTQRGNVLSELKKLEETLGQEAANSCSDAQKEQIDQQVTLLLAMDRDIARLIASSKKILLEEIKENKKRQQIANYANPSIKNGSSISY
ncbi:MAG: hypothetical protein PHT29_08095 [Eubacteriales bacterium]|jgi:hypothetical protein|nr:hypothetical protein [Eubacteriales bacterium]MDD3290831.1 hypothetical protein [Eubacteriales bacterium]MDD3863265.1 hypothetical protein [Eubacteriales bacterium]MDD4445850.1 hypothetical protein [Eubacteriales bacterium]